MGRVLTKRSWKIFSLVSGDGIVFHQLDALKQKISVKNQDETSLDSQNEQPL